MVIGIVIISLIFVLFIFPIIICSEIKLNINNLCLTAKIKLFGLLKIIKITLIFQSGGFELRFAKRSKFIPFSSLTFSNNKFKYLKNIKILNIKALYKTECAVLFEYYKFIKCFFYYMFFNFITNNNGVDHIRFYKVNTNNNNELSINLTMGTNMYIIFNNFLRKTGEV